MNPITSQNLIITDANSSFVFPTLQPKKVVLATKENVKKWTKAQDWHGALKRTFGNQEDPLFYTKKTDRNQSVYVIPQVYKVTHENCKETVEESNTVYNPDTLISCQNCSKKITPLQESSTEYEFYPFGFNEKTPNRIYLFDDVKRTIWMKCLLITIGSPFYLLAKTVDNLYKATIGNTTNLIKHCRGLPLPPTSKKDRWWHPIADLIRTPIYITITAIVAVAAVIIGAIAPSTLHTFRQLIGRIDRRYSWDQDTEKKNFVPCFHDHKIRKLVKNHILRHLEDYSRNHDFGNITSDPEKADNLIWYMLNSIATHQIRKIKGLADNQVKDEQERSCLKKLTTADPHAPYRSPLLKG